MEKEHDTHERLTVDLGGHVVSNIDANRTEQEGVFAVQVKERGPMHFTLLYVKPRQFGAWSKNVCALVRLPD